MVVGTAFNQFRIMGIDPFLFLWGLTAGAVTIVAGTGMDFYVTTGFTITDVVTEFSALTGRDA